MNYKNVLYFNTTRINTLAILDSLNNVKHWVTNSDGDDVEKIVPIRFGNYEKSIALEDLGAADINTGNINVIPRMVLAFRGMTKAPDRDTNKFQKISKRVITTEGNVMMQFGYNSVAYDFQYSLILQARGLNEAFMIVEQILPMFRPSYNISIREYPLFDEMTETQLSIEDPSFDILEEFEETDVNIVTVEFGLNLRGNLYMPLQLQGPIETLRIINWLWDTQEIKDSRKASHYEYDVCPADGKVFNESINRQFAPPKLARTVTEKEEEDPLCTVNEAGKSVLQSEALLLLLSESGDIIITEDPE